MKSNFKTGDSVVVKEGVIEPDLEDFELSGWEGRVSEIDTETDQENNLITIEWDSITLTQIPLSYIENSEINGFGWSNMILYEKDLEKSIPRDNIETTKKVLDELTDKYRYTSLEEQGKRISKILYGVDFDDDFESFQKWQGYLNENLTFPIETIVVESQGGLMLQNEDKLLIKSLDKIVDTYGIMTSFRRSRNKYWFPLCNLEVIDKVSTNYQFIKDYCLWYANR